MNRLVLISVLSLTAACSRVKNIDSPMKQLNSGVDLKAPPGKARVIVARPHRGTAFRMAYHVIADDKYAGDTFDDTAFAIDLEPGQHKVCAGYGPNVVGTLEAGKTYVVRVDLTFTAAKPTAIKANSDDRRDLLNELPAFRGTQTIVPFTEDALRPDEVVEMAGTCAAADKDLSPEDRAAQTLAAGDAL